MCGIFSFLTNHKTSVDQDRLWKFNKKIAQLSDNVAHPALVQLHTYINTPSNFTDLGVHTRSLTNAILDDFTDLADKLISNKPVNVAQIQEKYEGHYHASKKLGIIITAALTAIAVASMLALIILFPPIPPLFSAITVTLFMGLVVPGGIGSLLTMCLWDTKEGALQEEKKLANGLDSKATAVFDALKSKMTQLN